MGKRPSHGLVEDSFRPLREEADRLAQAIAKLRGVVTGGGGGAGSSQAAEDRERAREWREQKKDLRELGQDFRELQQSIRAAGPLAKQLGLEQTRLHLDAISQRIDVLRPGFGAIVNSLKIMGSLFKPVLAAVAVMGGGLLGVQKIIEATTGASLSLSQTVQGVGLALVKAYYDARVAAEDFYKEALGGQEKLDEIAARTNAINRAIDEAHGGGTRTPDVGLGQSDAQIAQQALSESLQELMSNARGGTQSAATLLKGLFDDIVTGLEGILPTIDETGERARNMVAALADPTPFEMFQANLAQMADFARNTYDAVLSGIQAVSGAIATTLFKAFTEPHQDIRDRFIVLFQQLGQMILQFIIQALIAKAIMAALGAATGGVGTVVGEGISGIMGTAASGVSGAFGFADGGKVGAGGRPSLLHMLARGFANGGLGRPAGLDPSDTVPAWLGVGEFVEPVRAVRKYGESFMESVRSLQFPESVARAFSAGVRPPAASSLPRLGYASGGPVGGGSMGGSGVQVVPAVLANERTMETLYAGGRRASLNFFAENAMAIRGALGI